MATTYRTISIEDQDGDLVDFPAVNAICPCCKGEGKVENPAFSNGFSAEEFVECFDDEDSQQAYFDGVYDVVCPKCHGERIILVIDMDREFTPEQQALLEYNDEQMRDAEDSRREQEAEIRMGA